MKNTEFPIIFSLQLWTCNSKIFQSLCSSTQQCWRYFLLYFPCHICPRQHETFFFCTNLPCRRHKTQQ